jgi:AAA15 family ATPase/GTPase
MIIEFSLENYRSVFSKQTLSFVAYEGENQEDLDSDRTIKTGDADIPNLVRSAVVYGPNASGKSNLVFALSAMQNLVLHSTELGSNLEDNYTPFLLNDEGSKKPTFFEICVFIDGVYYNYGFSYNHEKIAEEFLFSQLPGEEEVLIFKRNTEKNEWIFSESFKKNEGGFHDTWRGMTRPDALFLTTAVRFNSQYLKKLYDWFSSQLVIIGAFDMVDFSLIAKKLDDHIYAQKMVNFLKHADIHVDGIRSRQNVTIEFAHKLENGNIVWFDRRFESKGTQSFLAYGDLLHDVLETGKLLVIDEVERHLHPDLVKLIIHLFQNTIVNKNNSQILAITHNTPLLSSDILDRNQVWFIEKDERQSTHLYPLVSFEGESSGDLEKEYLAGHYGALPYADYWKGFEE